MNEEQGIQYLVDRGFAPHQAAGILGNLAQESGLDPAAVGDSGKAYGIAQWRDSRRSALMDYAKRSNRNPADMATQLDFLVDELQGPERRAMDKLLETRDAPSAALAFSKHYERPGDPKNEKRMSKAQQVLDHMMVKWGKPVLDAIIPPAQAEEAPGLPPLPDQYEEISEAAPASTQSAVPPIPDQYEEIADDPEPEKPGLLDSPEAQTAVRSTVRGLTSPLSFAQDVVTAPWNLLAKGVNHFSPGTLPYAPSGAESIDSWLRLGGINPEPASTAEKAVTAALGAASGSGLTKSAKEAAAAAAEIVKNPQLVNALKTAETGLEGWSAAPIRGMFGAGAAATGSDIATSLGANPFESALAGAFSAALANGAGGTLSAIGGGIKRGTDPLSLAGKERIAARALRRQATAPETTLARLSNPEINKDIIGGSKGTLAEVSQDPGLAALQRSLPSMDLAKVAGVDQINNIRLTEMDKSIRNLVNRANSVPKKGQQDVLNLLQQQKNNVLDAFDESVASQGKHVYTIPVDVSGIKAHIDALRAEHVGKSAIEKVLDQIEGKLKAEPPTGATQDSFKKIWNIRQDLDDSIYETWQNSSKATQNDLATIGKQLRGTMNEALVEAEPSFKKFLRRYSRAQQAEDRIKLGRDLFAKTQNNSRNIAGEGELYGSKKLSGNKIENLDDKISQLEAKGTTLSRGQKRAFDQAMEEKRRADVLESGGRGSNSQTAPYFATGKLLTDDIVGGILGDRTGNASGAARSILETAVGRPLDFALRSAEPEIMRIIGRALNDPDYASQLLKKGTLGAPVTLRGLAENTGKAGLLGEFYNTLNR